MLPTDSYLKVPAWIINDPVFREDKENKIKERDEKLVFAAIYSFTSTVPNSSQNIRISYISELTMLSRRTVTRMIGILEKKGLFSVRPSTGTISLYILKHREASESVDRSLKAERKPRPKYQDSNPNEVTVAKVINQKIEDDKAERKKNPLGLSDEDLKTQQLFKSFDKSYEETGIMYPVPIKKRGK